MNFVRNVTFQIKTGKTAEFGKLLNQDVLPVMKQQPGFKHELAMVSGAHGIGLSVWSDKASAEKYQTAIYPEVVKKLSPVLEGTPKVEHYELAASTLGG